MNRRHLLSGLGAFTGGMVAAGVVDYASSPASESGTDTPVPSLAPSVSVRAASPSSSDAAQPGGGLRNQFFQDSTKSPVAFNEKKAILYPDQLMGYKPKID